jgi:hypothetical protein
MKSLNHGTSSSVIDSIDQQIPWRRFKNVESYSQSSPYRKGTMPHPVSVFGELFQSQLGELILGWLINIERRFIIPCSALVPGGNSWKPSLQWHQRLPRV